MKYLPLLWSSLWRKKVRTIFTLLSVFVAFLLFGLLMTIRTAFSFGVDIAGLDRLVLIHKVSLIMPLPVSYLERLRAISDVSKETRIFVRADEDLSYGKVMKVMGTINGAGFNKVALVTQPTKGGKGK